MTVTTRPALVRGRTSGVITHPRPAEALRTALSAIVAAVRPQPGAARRLAGLWAVARTPVLTVCAFSCVTVAAFCVAVALGWLVAGASLLILEALTTNPTKEQP
jgi:hypothetical protein